MNTELFVKPFEEDSYSRVELTDDLPVQVTFSIRDVREPEKKQSHFSEEAVKIPGTAQNNKVLNHIFQVGINCTFNVNKKADFYLEQDSIEVMRGVFQLKSITEQEGLIYYNVVLYAGIEDLFSRIGDAMLTDLDFSDMDHEYNRSNIEDSWSDYSVLGYTYPMIDYGRSHEDSTEFWKLKNFDFRPAILAKEYWDRIFEYAGKSYSSTFLGENLFSGLIIPFTAETYKYTNAELEAREFRAEKTSDQVVPYSNAGPQSATATFTDDSTGLNYDPSGVYDTATSIWTVPTGKAGYYNIEVAGELTVRLQVGGAYNIGFFAYLAIRRTPSGGSASNIAGQAYNPSAVGTFSANGETPAEQVNCYREGIYLDEGDTVHVTFIASRTALDITLFPCDLMLKDGAYFKCTAVNAIAEGSTLSMNNAVPQKITMRDFILGICRMFNLFIEENRDNPGELIVETRDDYFQSTVVDWSKKLDKSQELEILPMSELQGRIYKFRYKQDRDYENSYYQDKYKFEGVPQTYGEFDLLVDNDWVTQEVVTEPIFSPTPMVGASTHTRIIPRISKIKETEGTYESTEANIRILYFGSSTSFAGQRWAIEDSAGVTTYVTYPYAGHLDDPLNPVFDLSFGMPREVQWQIRRELYTDANLYNVYHRRSTEEIIHTDARLIKGWFRLRPQDLSGLSFRKLYYIEGDFFRLNKIEEHDLSGESLTACEFIRALDPGVFVPEQTTVIGGVGDPIGDTRPPDDKPPIDPKDGDIIGGRDNFVPGGTSGYMIIGSENLIGQGCSNIKVLGDGNEVEGGSSNIDITGSTNVVGDTCSNIKIVGSENEIEPGLENIVLINCSGLTITGSDETWINGCEYSCPP